MRDDLRQDDGWYARIAPRRGEPDAHGQAALLLTESLLHMLVETHVLTIAQAVGAVRSAGAVKAEVAEATGESDARMHHSLSLLAEIERSLAAIGDVRGATAQA